MKTTKGYLQVVYEITDEEIETVITHYRASKQYNPTLTNREIRMRAINTIINNKNNLNTRKL